MDVEDPINPLADDAALELVNVFTDAEVRGSFCVTGEKCRTLAARGRTDVVAAFLPHCLGLHTDTHSYHPTTMELLADLTYEQGTAAAIAAERKGFEAFTGLFGRSPVFWGGAGNTWSPEITEALQHLSIPAYAYALTALPGDAVHRYNGVLALPQTLSVGEDDWCKGPERGMQVLDELDSIGQPWVGIFVGHPTRFRHVAYWDLPFNHGRTPPTPEFTPPTTTERYETAKASLRTFLNALRDRAEIIGIDEVVTRTWAARTPTSQELQFFREQTARNIRGAAGWPIHRPGLDTENIVRKALALEGTVEVLG